MIIYILFDVNASYLLKTRYLYYICRQSYSQAHSQINRGTSGRMGIQTDGQRVRQADTDREADIRVWDA